MGCNRVFDQVLPGSHRVFSFPVFSSTRPGSSSGSAESQVDPSGRVSKLWHQVLGLPAKADPRALDLAIKKSKSCCVWLSSRTQKLLGPAGTIVSSTVETLHVYSVIHSAMSLCPQHMHNIFSMSFKVQHNYLSLTSYFLKSCPIPAPSRPGQPANSYIILDKTPSRARWRPNELHALGYVGSFCVFECLMQRLLCECFISYIFPQNIYVDNI